MAPRPQEIKVWQWNCRGYKNKRGNLQLHIQQLSEKPDVIALQEASHPIKLTGYTPFIPLNTDPKKTISVTATFVQRNIAAIQHEIEDTKVQHTLVEIPPRKKGDGNVYILNVYSSPKDRTKATSDIIRKAVKLAGKSQLVVVGDFNAHHPAWGYRKAHIKGTALWQSIQDVGMTILNDVKEPTRIGNSVSTDTAPDLALSKNINSAIWTNTGLTLGSDHYIVETTFQTAPFKHPPLKTRLTNWDNFRKIRDKTAPKEIGNLNEWTRALKEDVKATTEETEAITSQHTTDPKLKHMWEAHLSLQLRWKNQKHNRTLRKRITQLERKIEAYAFELERQQWGQVCDSVNGHLGKKNTWLLLRHLLDPTQTKTAQRNRLAQIVHQHEGDTEDLIKELKDRYLNTTESTDPLPWYEGEPNPELDQEFSTAEVWQAISQLKTTSAAGPDGVTNKMLRNLDLTSVMALTDLINKYWQDGEIPQEWKHARIIFIPKPGKKLITENLRPISLTSCLGKLMEHVVLNRLQGYEEDNNLLPPSMLGFRAHLSTQDVMLQLSEEVIPKSSNTRAILGLDLNKAFDNVSHEAILTNLSRLNPGSRTFNYVRSFLDERTAEISIGGTISDPFRMGCRGTPQGSVLSPFLFNLALVELPKQLEAIPNLRHTLYADDITLWITTGNDGEIEETLQRAVDTIEAYVKAVGLECSHPKSELLIKRDIPRGQKSSPSPANINVHVQGKVIKQVTSIRILGMIIQENRNNTQVIEKLNVSVHQTIRLIRRIANRRRGVKENDLCRLVQAFVISRMTYALPYLQLYNAEKLKIEGLIRQAYKAALGLPINTSTNKLLQLGLHNTLDELTEAHRRMQELRLARTNAGRAVLRRLGINAAPLNAGTRKIPSNVRKTITVKPLPKNMHPAHHEGRRRARAQALAKKFEGRTDVVYVDAAAYVTPKKAYAIAAVTEEGQLVANATVPTNSSEIAEEAAIALALTNSQARVIVSDSKAAIGNFAKGRISPISFGILKNYPKNRQDVELVWVPAHTSNPGNEAAHDKARGSIGRAVDDNSDVGLTGDGLNTYHEITQHYRLERLTFPPPHKNLTKEQELLWRQLQTKTLPNPAVLSHAYPDRFKPDCSKCGGKATVDHIFWDCPADPPPLSLQRLAHPGPWENLLLSSDLETQIQAVTRAQEVAASLH